VATLLRRSLIAVAADEGFRAAAHASTVECPYRRRQRRIWMRRRHHSGRVVVHCTNQSTAMELLETKMFSRQKRKKGEKELYLICSRMKIETQGTHATLHVLPSFINIHERHSIVYSPAVTVSRVQ
jgi:hypothetical protein